MKRRSRAGGQPVKARPRKAVTLKRRTAPKAVRRHGRSAGNLQEQLDLRTRELNEALEQQTATSEVLEVISSSPGDLEPIFAAMLEKAARICDAAFGNIYRWDGDALHLVGTHNTPPGLAEARGQSPVRATAEMPVGRMLATKTTVHVADLAAEPVYTEERDPTIVAGVELGGIRTLLLVPMLKENQLIGVFSLYRQEVRPFSDKQIALVFVRIGLVTFTAYVYSGSAKRSGMWIVRRSSAARAEALYRPGELDFALQTPSSPEEHRRPRPTAAARHRSGGRTPCPPHKFDRTFGHSFEHRVGIEGRAVDDLEHVGGGSLLLKRFAQFTKQSRFLDGDDGLAAKFDSKAMCLSVKGWTWIRRITITPMIVSPFSIGAARTVPCISFSLR
jgi:GAF domain